MTQLKSELKFKECLHKGHCHIHFHGNKRLYALYWTISQLKIKRLIASQIKSPEYSV